MKRKTSAEEWQRWCDDIAKDLAYLRAFGPDLISRARYGVRDGYPSSSMGGSVTSGSSDPVGELAVADKRRDPIRNSAQRMKRYVEDASKLIQHAANEAKASQPIADEMRPLDRGVPLCRNCNGDARPRPKDGECEACYKYLQRNGRERPQHLWRKAG